MGQKQAYKVVLKLNGKEYTAENEDLGAALLSIKPEFYKTKGILTVSKDDKSTTQVLNVWNVRRLFGGAGTNTQKIILGFRVNRFKFLLGE